MTPERLHANFPDDIPLPSLLIQLCAYTEATGNESLGGDFGLIDNGRQLLGSGFRDYPDHLDRFVIFASDGADSLYGYWRYDGQPLDGAPLVYLNDEGIDNMVLANTLTEFLTLIAVGQSQLGLVDKWDENEGPDLYTLWYRAWLREELGVDTPTLTEARAIVEQARDAHPDLDLWVEQLVTGHV